MRCQCDNKRIATPKEQPMKGKSIQMMETAKKLGISIRQLYAMELKKDY